MSTIGTKSGEDQADKAVLQKKDAPTEAEVTNEKKADAPAATTDAAVAQIVLQKKDAPAEAEETNEKKADAPAANTDAAVAQPPPPEGSEEKKDVTVTDPADANDEKIPTASHDETEIPQAVQAPHEPRTNWSETIFPMKLYDILCNPEFSHAISWMPHGRSWKVLNKEYFMAEICPQYFSQSRFESFIRQVNGWGFKRLRREGPDRSSYYHENFLRGFPHLIEQLRRPSPGEKARDTREEPDFSAMAPLPQLTKGMMMKVGKTRTGPARSSFNAVPPKDHPPYPLYMGGWGAPPPYFPFAPYPPPGAPSSPYRGGGPPPLPPPSYSYPPASGWGPPPPGPNPNSSEPPHPNHPPIGYPYPPPYDPHFYSYPPPPATPQHGRPRGDSAAQTPKRDREETANSQSEQSPKRPMQQQPYAMQHYGPPPPMGYYYPPPMYGEMTPRKEADSALASSGPTESDKADQSK
jgi:hypothetical protein